MNIDRSSADARHPSDLPDAAEERSALAHLRATTEGDVRAFRRLHARFHGPVMAFAARILGRQDRAEEVANDTMLAIWRGAARFEGRSRVSTWVFGIAYRQALKARRRFGFERLHMALDLVANRPDPGLADADPFVDADLVAAATAALPVRDRALVHMTYGYGFTAAEIAEVTGWPVGTVKTRLGAARRRMRERLTEIAR